MSNRMRWSMLVIALAVVTLATGLALNRYVINQNIENASQNLLLLSDLRRQALERYFETAEAELRFWAERDDLVKQQEWLNAAWDRAVAEGRDPEQQLQDFYIHNNPYPPGDRKKFNDEGTSENPYRQLHGTLHPLARKFVEQRGYYDFFLISPPGNIHYTVEKESDFGTNLVHGAFRDTGLADVFQRALEAGRSDAVAVSDLAFYSPSDAPAMFMAKAMHNENDDLVGVLALQVPTEHIIDIMDFRAGMGKTGETYVVGDDLLMRSNSRFTDESTILIQEVDTVPVAKALNGERGVSIETDYRGVSVLSAYSAALIDGNTWAVLAEIDEAEVLERATSDNPRLAAIMLFFYSLALWSVWFVQRSGDGQDSAGLINDLDGGFDRGDG